LSLIKIFRHNTSSNVEILSRGTVALRSALHHYLDSAFTTFFISFVILGFELKASHLVGRFSTIWTTPLALFMLGIVEIEPWELFAQAGFEPQFSWSLPPE
jgi:hypothetical protein